METMETEQAAMAPKKKKKQLFSHLSLYSSLVVYILVKPPRTEMRTVWIQKFSLTINRMKYISSLKKNVEMFEVYSLGFYTDLGIFTLVF